jgi:hypothetical protein
LEKADDYVLEEILSLIQIENGRDKVIQIPEHYKRTLDKSIAQMEAGNTVPNEVVENKIEQWLYK